MKVDALASARTDGTDPATALLDVDTRTAESIASCGKILTGPLAANGVDTVFGSPGNPHPGADAADQGSGMRFLPPRHEQGAGFMAAGDARISGRPGICLLISGPGLLNAATALAQAKCDSPPMLGVSQVLETTDLSSPRG